MGSYCYRSRGKRGRLITRVFPSSDIPEEIVEHGVRFSRSREDEWAAISVPASTGWPMECVASGVHASQADELRKFYKDHGCPTEVSADGNPIYRSAAHRRKALKLRGFKDRASYL